MNPSGPSEISVLLERCAQGDASAENELFAVAFQELRMLAGRAFAGEQRGHLLQPSVLVNEAFLRMPRAGEIDWQGRQHFFAIAARAMRRALIDHAKQAAALKRPRLLGGIELEHLNALDFRDPDLVLMVDEALTVFAEQDPRRARVVEMRYFAEMTLAEIAAVVGRDERTVIRDWNAARLWLLRYLKEGRAQ